MQIRIYHDGRSYLIEVPAGTRVVRTSGEDCLVYSHDNRIGYLLTPFADHHARAGTKGLKLIDEVAIGILP